MFVVKSVEYNSNFLEMVTPISSNEMMTMASVEAMLANRGKMQLAKRIHHNISARLKVTDERETSAVFRFLVETHLGCTEATSRNYLNNITSPSGMYRSNKAYNKKVRDQIRAQKTAPIVDQVEVPVTPVVEQVKPVNVVAPKMSEDRWGVLNINTNIVVTTCTSRELAQKVNRDMKSTGANTRLWDRNKEPNKIVAVG